MTCYIIIMSPFSCNDAKSSRGVLRPVDIWMSSALSTVTINMWYCVTFFRNSSSSIICSQMSVFSYALLAEFFSTASRAGSWVLRLSWWKRVAVARADLVKLLVENSWYLSKRSWTSASSHRTESYSLKPDISTAPVNIPRTSDKSSITIAVWLSAEAFWHFHLDIYPQRALSGSNSHRAISVEHRWWKSSVANTCCKSKWRWLTRRLTPWA